MAASSRQEMEKGREREGRGEKREKRRGKAGDRGILRGLTTFLFGRGSLISYTSVFNGIQCLRSTPYASTFCRCINDSDWNDPQKEPEDNCCMPRQRDHKPLSNTLTRCQQLKKRNPAACAMHRIQIAKQPDTKKRKV